MLVDSGKLALCEVAVGQALSEEYDFCLYTNSFTWGHSITLGDLTEAAWSGYARVNIPSWTTPALDVAFDAIAEPTAGNVVFNNTSGSAQIAVGYFVVGHTSGILYAGGPFGAPIAFDPTGSRDFQAALLINTL